MNAPDDSTLVWMRRDLRCDDHAALTLALRESRRVWCVFVFDTDILEGLPSNDRRLAFLHATVSSLDHDLRQRATAHGGGTQAGLVVLHGRAQELLPALAQRLGARRVVVAHDDDPYALSRDQAVGQALARQGVAWTSVKDHVVFERAEVMTQSGTPYGVFTPYKNAWLKRLAAQPQALDAHDPGPGWAHLADRPEGLRGPVPSLDELGFGPAAAEALNMPTGNDGAERLWEDFQQRIDAYDQRRDFPALKGPSYLSTHLRFGTLSVRRLASHAWSRAEAGSSGAAVWLSELIWRDFYHQILFHHPRVVDRAFKPEYDRIAWATGPEADRHFQAWCEGQTGYPLVDAAMRQLNQTGYMHNRLRMVVSSFLIKDLGIDWRRGEAYFALKLLDFDLAANNGGWQWAASSGCDAQPYFRIFNPVSQSEKFDAKGAFIRRYVPELAGLPDHAIHAPWLAKPMERLAAGVTLGQGYPQPLVAHDEARALTLARYQVVKAPASATTPG